MTPLARRDTGWLGRLAAPQAGGRQLSQVGQLPRSLSEQFAYVFDLGDNWQHLCTVGPKLADPMESLGTVPDRPLPCWGWGDIPDQYGRRWNGDGGSTPMPPAPDGMADLPPILPWWGPQPSRGRQANLPSGEVTEIRYRARGYQPPIELTAQRLPARR